MINAAQIRAARAITRENQSEFSNNCGISVPLLKMIELEEAGVTLKTAEKIIAYMEAKNYEFTEEGGIQPISGHTQVYSGQKGFVDFIRDVYATISVVGGEICVNNVDESLFLKWQGDEADAHMQRMSSLTNYQFKILVKEGDSNFVASKYAIYKWSSADRFDAITYYIYGKKVATIIFQAENVVVYVTKDQILADYHRQKFNFEWERAIEPIAL
ncbi:MAG: hypothetical protein CMH30_04070 [Micavibrio sp.]|nr:hypothetical protein [Micavibrio sp.]